MSKQAPTQVQDENVLTVTFHAGISALKSHTLPDNCKDKTQMLVHQTMAFSCYTQNTACVHHHSSLGWSTCLSQPSGSAGQQPECLLLLPHCQPFCPASSLLLAQRSQAAILSVLHRLRKACSTKTKGVDFCFPSCSVLLPWCTWSGFYSKRQLCCLVVHCWVFRNQIVTAISLVLVC